MCDTLVWPGGFCGREFRPLDVSQVETRLTRRGAQVLCLPLCAWLKQKGLPEVYASSGMVGVFAALMGIDMEQVEALLGDSWKDTDREDNLAVCRWAHGYALALVELGRVAEAV